MIEFNTETGLFHIKGSVAELTAEMLSTIKIMYMDICENSAEAGEIFKTMMEKYIHTAFLSEDTIKQMADKSEKAAKQQRDELINMLDDLKDTILKHTTHLDKDVKDSDGDEMMSFEEFEKLIKKKEEEL